MAELGSFAPAFDGLLDDLNTPEALGQVFTAMKGIKPAELSAEDARREFLGLSVIMAALGLQLPVVEDEAEVDAPAEIVEMAQARWQAKQDKDWGEADRLRDELAAAGWEIKDTKEGFELCPKS